jgi:hypothetical protein
MLNLTLIYINIYLLDIAAGPYELWLKSVAVAPQIIQLLGSDDTVKRQYMY